MPAAPPRLTIDGLQVRAVDAPMARPLVTGGGTLQSAPLVLIDLQTEEGIVGSSYVFCQTRLALAPLARLVANLETLIKGETVAPLVIDNKLGQHFRLLGPR